VHWTVAIVQPANTMSRKYVHSMCVICTHVQTSVLSLTRTMCTTAAALTEKCNDDTPRAMRVKRCAIISLNSFTDELEELTKSGMLLAFASVCS
jgi:hypothetical protein